MGKSVTFRMVEHDPGGFKIPIKAKNSGQFILDVDKGKNSFHFDGTREKLGGSMAGWTVVTEPVATTHDGKAIRVTTALRTKPDVAPRRFVLLGVSKAEFDALLEEMRPALAAQEEQVNQVVSAKSSGQWWAGLGKVTMTHVLYGGKDGILKVAPDDGLQWSPGLGKTRIPFGAIAKIEIGETTRQHGRQHGAIGFGGIGLAVVAATAVHNHRAARADTYNVIAVTTKDGKQHQFATQKALSPLGPFYEAYRKASAPAPAPAPAATPRPAVAPSPPAATIGGAKATFVNYDGGFPSHPQPEATGMLLLPGSGPTIGRWELHWVAEEADLESRHEMIFGGLARYPFSVEATGPTSCRVTISDTQDPAVVAHFDLPTTAATALETVLAARAPVIERGRRAAELANANKAPAAVPASSHLGVADELAKLADLHEKGVLSEEEFASQKAKLLSE